MVKIYRFWAAAFLALAVFGIIAGSSKIVVGVDLILAGVCLATADILKAVRK